MREFGFSNLSRVTELNLEKKNIYDQKSSLFGLEANGLSNSSTVYVDRPLDINMVMKKDTSLARCNITSRT